MPTIRDVAERAKVSVSTASRILSNSTKEKFSEKTRLKVLRASEELGYRPNLAARALVSGKTRIIAAIFPRIYDTPFTSLASLQILSGIETYCSENGYHVLISSPRIIDGVVDPHFTTLLSSGYLDGVIVNGHYRIDPIMKLLEPFGLPTIMLGYHPHPHFLRCDNQEGGWMMMKHVIELGHTRIGVIALPEMGPRMDGVRMGALAHGINFEALPRVDGTFTEDSGAAAALTLLNQNPDITALVCLNDRMAMGAIRQLKVMGFKVPEEISVIGYDDLPQARDFNPPLTTINQQLSKWGALAMSMLLELVQGLTPGSIVLEPKLVVRESTAPPAVRSQKWA